MDSVHFLNIEYLLLRTYEFLFSSPVVTGTIEGVQAPASEALRPIAFTLGTVAVLGMLLTIIFLVILVWVRIRLVVVEHEGFGEEEFAAAQVAEGAPPPEPKNPRWERVLQLANTQNESDWRLAILEADIMLGDLLQSQGYRGDGIGEKLRDANPLQFSTLDLAWQAHKVRNDIAHAGEGFHLSARDANATIDLYRRVFEEFQYI